VEDYSLSHTARYALAPVAFVFGCVLCFAGTSEAFTLHRLAAAIDMSGVAAASNNDLAVSTGDAASGLPNRLTLPSTIELDGPSTEIRVGIPRDCDLSIEVSDQTGAPLFLALAHMHAGWQKVGFSGRDTQGRSLVNGIYYYTLTADGYSRTTQVTINR
jgi:hypothetical protein